MDMVSTQLDPSQNSMRNIAALAVLGLLLTVGSAQAQTLMGWQLNETNTGLAGVGIDRDTLPLCSLQPDQYGWLWPATGTVIRGKRIENPICLQAGNITIEQCWFKLTVDPGSGMPMITDFNFNTMKSCTLANVVRDCDIDGTFLADTGGTRSGFPSVGSVGVWQRNNIYGVGCGYVAGGNGVPILVENNYIHDLRTGATSHDDGLTLRSRSAPRTYIRGNRIDATTIHTTGALFLQATFGFLDSMYIEGNLLEGNGYNLILEWNGYGYGRVWAMNNRFRPAMYGSGYVDGGGGWLGWQDMYLNDSTKADNRGTALNEFMPQANAALAAPGNLVVTLPLRNQAHLAWNDNAASEKGFRVERSVDGGAYLGINLIDSNTTVYDDTGLTAGNYAYRVAAYNKSGLSGYSNVTPVQVSLSVRRGQADRHSPMAMERPSYSASELSRICRGSGLVLYTVDGARLRAAGAISRGLFVVRDGERGAVRKVVLAP
jgi:hypothetical protein